MSRVRQAEAMAEPQVTYDSDTHRYTVTLDGDQMIALRYTLAQGVEELEAEARYLRTMNEQPTRMRDIGSAAQRGRALSESIETQVRAAHGR